MLGIVGRLLAMVRHWDREPSSRFILLATAGVAVFSLGRPMDALYAIATLPLEQERTVYAVTALACYLPLQVWLVLSAARDVRGRRQTCALAAMAVVIIGMLPVAGIQWIGTLYTLAALVLVSVRPPWSLLLFAALVATPAPVCFALGQPEWAVYFTVGMLGFPVPLAVLILLIRATRQLQDARLALAEQAVLRERLRIDEEVRESVGAGLATIAAQGRQAGEMAARDPSAAVDDLRGLVDDTRRTLAETRRIVTRYREVSLLAELRTIAALLMAAGIDTRLELPPDLPNALDEQGRVSMRRGVARLLEETAPSTSVTIAVTA